MKIALISHSRIGKTAEPGEKYSEVWAAICKGAERKVRRAGLSGVKNLKIFSPVSYHDHKEFLTLVDAAVGENPDALILPFMPTEDDLVKEMTEILSDYQGKIIAVNVPPTPEIEKRLKNIVGYVGMNEFEAGRMAVRRLFMENETIERIIVVEHEKGHYGHRLRTEGARKESYDSGIQKVVEIYVGAEEYETENLKNTLEGSGLSTDSITGIITLGVRGTEAALKAIDEAGIVVPIVGMDLNEAVREAIESGRVLATLIQHPEDEGRLAVKMAIGAVNSKLERRVVYCGPTLVDKNNIAVF